MKNLIPKTQMFLKRHSPTILTCIGAAGVVATAVTAVKATPKAMQLLKASEEQKGEKLTVLETVKVAGPAYIPATIIGASTIACIFGANVLNKKQQASLAGAYALLDSSYKEYRNAVAKVCSEEDNRKIISELASNKGGAANDGTVLIYDDMMVRYYRASLEDIKNAEKEINKIFKKRGYVCLQEFYDLLGGAVVLDPEYSYGWNNLDGQYVYGCDHIEFNVDLVTNSDGSEFYVLTMPFAPVTDYLL